MSQIEIISNELLEITRSANGEFEFFEGVIVPYYDGTPQSEYRFSKTGRERVLRGSFAKVFKDQKNFEMWFNHNKDMKLGSTNTGLELLDSNKGPRCRLKYNHRDVFHQMARSKIEDQMMKGMSIRATAKATTTKENGEYVRSLTDIVELTEFSPVYDPCYTATECVLRSKECQEWEETMEWMKKLEDMLHR